MAMYLSQEDLQVYFYHIHAKVAKELKIEDYDWKSTQELSNEIALINTKLSGYIENLVHAYQAWYAVHLDIDRAGSAGNLSPEEQSKLDEAIAIRDSARKEFIEKIEKP